MSVINQMLKDLDKRQHDSAESSGVNSQIIVKQGHSQRWIIVILLLLLTVSLGIIAWQKINPKAEEQSVAANPYNTISMESNNAINTSAATSNIESEKQISTPNASPSSLMKIKNGDNQTTDSLSQITAEKNEIVQSKSESVQVQENDSAISELEVASTEFKGTIEVDPVSEPTLTISRKQLTPDQLASKKIAQAEQAIANKDISKAEQLFEEVLLVVPYHKSARKQLAALWFGKQFYQAALNLLSQGLALDNQDAEFRLMKARIYLSQGQAQLALNDLKVLDNIRSVEYQSLLASTAQQLSLFATAEKAYNILTELSPNVGRWWLGLAIAQDSQSYFEQAITSYKTALKQADLSSETAQFAANRIIELGE